MRSRASEQFAQLATREMEIPKMQMETKFTLQQALNNLIESNVDYQQPFSCGASAAQLQQRLDADAAVRARVEGLVRQAVFLGKRGAEAAEGAAALREGASEFA